MKKLLYTIFIIIVFACNSGDCNMQKLYHIDSLLDSMKYDSVNVLLSKVNPQQLNDEEKAFFDLISIQYKYISNIAITDTTILDNTIDYYKHHNDTEKLARAYHYKSIFLYGLKYTRRAVFYETLSENIMKSSNLRVRKNIILYQKICERMALINCKNEEYKEAIYYAKKSYDCLIELKDTTFMAYSLGLIFSSYNDFEQKDSAKYYINKCIPLLNKADEYTQCYINSALCGYYTSVNDTAKADFYIQKALNSRYADGLTFNQAGHYYYKIGNTYMAEKMWKMAPKYDNDFQRKANSYKNLANLCMKRGDIEGYRKYMAAVVAAKDSIYKASKKDNVGRYQAELQGDISKRRTMSTLLYIGIAIVLIAISAFVFVRYKAGELKRTIKGKESMLEQEKEKSKALEKDLHKTSQRVKTLETSNRQSQKEIKRLNKANEEIELSARRGKQLMEILISGKAKIGQWNNEDYACCIAYCKIEHSQLADEIAAVNPQTSMRNILTAILHEIGYSYAQLGDMFAIKADSIRKNLSRMHKPGEEEPQCEDADFPTP